MKIFYLIIRWKYRKSLLVNLPRFHFTLTHTFKNCVHWNCTTFEIFRSFGRFAFDDLLIKDPKLWVLRSDVEGYSFFSSQNLDFEKTYHSKLGRKVSSHFMQLKYKSLYYLIYSNKKFSFFLSKDIPGQSDHWCFPTSITFHDFGIACVIWL